MTDQMTVNQTIGANLRRIRKNKFIPAKTLAAAIYVSDSTLTSWERGVTQISNDHLADLCRILECRSIDILGF